MTANEFRPTKVKARGIEGDSIATYYDDENGTKLEVKGAAPAVRFNNPGNIACTDINNKTGRWVVSQGGIGCAQGRAVFPDVETGSQAMKNNLEDKFGKYTVREMLFGEYEYYYASDKVTPVGIKKTIRAGYCPEWYYDKKGVFRHQDTESYARLLEKGSDTKETDDLKKKAINDLGSKIFEKVVQKMKTHEGFFSPRNQGTKTFYNKNGKVIKLNELDKNLRESVTPEKPTMLAYTNGVYTDAPDEVLPGAVRAARNQKTRDAVELPEAKASEASGGGDAIHFPDNSDSPLQHAMAALELKSDEIHFTPAEADNGNKTSDTFHIRDNDTSDIIGSCVMTPGGCEMTAGDRKIVADRISGSDVNLETYARNDEGDFELLGMSRIGANDGITLRRPFVA